MKHLLWILALLPSTGFTENDIARISNLRTSSPSCETKMDVTQDAGGVMLSFHELQVIRGELKPFVRCRILGDVILPAGYQIVSSSPVLAKVRGHFEMPGDQVGAKLSVTLLDQRTSSLQALRQSSDISNETGEEHDLDIQTTLPEIQNKDAERTATISVQLEAMINYRLDQSSKVSAQIDSIRLPLVHLKRIDLPAKRESP